MDVGILGGTGPAGRGLALRLADGGASVVLGSRDEERAIEAARALGRQVTGSGAISGSTNAMSAACEVVVVATPWDGALATVRPLAGELAGKVVVSMVNALAKEGREMAALVPPRGSMAATIQAALPGARVAAAFHHLPAADMLDTGHRLDADVLVCSDHPDATSATLGLVEMVPGLDGVDCGSLAQAAAIEAFTAVLITVNIRHRAHAALRLTGLDAR
ncbi:MAG: NADPH-dependent F420 reductase [Actinomycetota bacterium]|jgi:hypothetical protein|nr:NADPH-dependent F420 reductase [Actinomycetota bacterium]MDA8341717.1 NADPH-dependent F420 reductase [Actinomycetota bacterium]